jgi:hypothetical protein
MRPLSLLLFVLAAAPLRAQTLQPPLPLRYAGDDFQKIATWGLALADVAAKNEYETTAEHAERVAALLRLPVLPGRPGDSTFTAVITTADASYDADQGLMTVKLETSSFPAIYETRPGRPSYKTLPVFNVRYTSRRVGSYTGRNAFGVSRRITSYAAADLALALYDDDLYDHEGRLLRHEGSYASELSIEDLGLYGLTFSVPREEAPALDAYLGVAVTFRLAAPYGRYERTTGEPTINNPEDVTTEYVRAVGTLEVLRVFNQRTGRVYATVFPSAVIRAREEARRAREAAEMAAEAARQEQAFQAWLDRLHGSTPVRPFRLTPANLLGPDLPPLVLRY